jgi:mono/diheme cytochrome c family protein
MIFKSRVQASASSASSAVACLLVLFSSLMYAQAKTWTLPAGAANEKNPLASSPDVLKKGESLYKSNCAGCHGPKGLGDGPNVDKKDRKQRPANLTLSRNPEGVMFYKIWNGRDDPDMPAFKSRMTKDEVWAVVAYAISLRP